MTLEGLPFVIYTPTWLELTKDWDPSITEGLERAMMTRFDTADEWSDFPRLARLLDRVERYCSNGHWVTLAELSQACGGTEASVSARLRDLRKRGHIVDRRQIRPGLWEYRVH